MARPPLIMVHVRVDADTVTRADRLATHDPGMGKPTRVDVLRAALRIGLTSLERRYGLAQAVPTSRPALDPDEIPYGD